MSDINIYVDRGDPAAYDFAVGDLTTDNTWNDLDLSSIVPAGATAVHISGWIGDDTAGNYILFRENGNSNEYNRAGVTISVANKAVDFNFIVSCDSSRIIEYLTANDTYTNINITVNGWIIPLSASDLTEFSADSSPTIDDLLYVINDPSGTPVDRKVTIQNTLKLAPHWVDRGDPSAFDWEVGDLTTDGNYHDLDLSSIVPSGATLVRLRVVLNDTAGNSVTFRENGNSNAHNNGDLFCQVSGKTITGQFVIPCDSNRVIEYRATNTSFTTLSILVAGWYIDTVN